KGTTTVKKSSQNQPVDATTLAFPEHVSVAMAEIAEHLGEGLLALAVGAGLQVMQTLMDADVTALAGPKGRHDQGRIAVRHGREHGSVSLGGRRVPVTRPRVRAADGMTCRPAPTARASRPSPTFSAISAITTLTCSGKASVVASTG